MTASYICPALTLMLCKTVNIGLSKLYKGTVVLDYTLYNTVAFPCSYINLASYMCKVIAIILYCVNFL